MCELHSNCFFVTGTKVPGAEIFGNNSSLLYLNSENILQRKFSGAKVRKFPRNKNTKD